MRNIAVLPLKRMLLWRLESALSFGARRTSGARNRGMSLGMRNYRNYSGKTFPLETALVVTIFRPPGWPTGNTWTPKTFEAVTRFGLCFVVPTSPPMALRHFFRHLSCHKSAMWLAGSEEPFQVVFVLFHIKEVR